MMKIKTLGCVLFLPAILPAMAMELPGSAAPARGAERAPTIDQIIIRFRDEETTGTEISAAGIARARSRLSELGAKMAVPLAYGRPMSGFAHVIKLPSPLPVAAVRALTERLARDSAVAAAEPDTMMQIQATPNDSLYPSQWHYFDPVGGINAPGAWDVSTGLNTVVAVVDTGIRPHADLLGQYLSGYDFISNIVVANDGNGRDADASDPGDWESAGQCFAGDPARNSSWHGTHVAGTIAARTNNSFGVAGVAYGAKILPVRVLGKCGGSMSDIIDGLRWAAGLAVPGVPANVTAAKVINLSLGLAGGCSSFFQQAINDVRAVGATVVAAAGNSNGDVAGHQPANCNGVIAVVATARDGGRAAYSNYGVLADIAAPGGERWIAGYAVLSTANAGTTTPTTDNYIWSIGTSMAAPHVSGVVALMYSVWPGLSPDFIENTLKATARPFPASAALACDSTRCGAGIVDAAGAVLQVKNTLAVMPLLQQILLEE